MGSANALALAIIIGLAVGVVALAALARRRPRPANFRPIEAFRAIPREIGLAVEAGQRVHVSLGSTDLRGVDGAATLAGLTVLTRTADMAAASDKPPVATSGDGTSAMLSQEVVRAAFRGQNALERYDPGLGRVTGLTPFSFAAGAMSTGPEPDVSAHLLTGPLGVEGALMADAAARTGARVVAGSHNVQAQALFYAASDHPLIGEELFVAGAYLNPSHAHVASLRIQDVLRWAIIGIILAGAALKSLGLVLRG